MRAIIVANGTVEDGETFAHRVREDDLVIAADGGALVAQHLGLHPSVIVGDLDSLSAEARAELTEQGVRLLDHPARKNETDTELALRYALEQGADEIVLLGATGSRLDHTLANVLLLAMPLLDGVPASIVSADTEIWLIRGGEELAIEGKAGDIVTLLPLGQDALGVTTAGLEWALENDTLQFGPARGVSNVLIAETARVALREGLLVALRVNAGGEERTHRMQDVEEWLESESGELVPIHVAQGHLRAHVIKSKLEAAGIPSMLSYDSASVVFGLTVDGIGEVRVMVRPEDAEQARGVLEESPHDS